jgi:hypothetical protein
MIRRLSLAIGAASLALSMAATGAAAAQPNVSCDNVGSAPAGFSSVGFLKADLVYANPDSTGGLMSGNGHVVSQYDIACIQVSAPRPRP